jgi:glycosyltransferase involved in cell wall biosynthesis
MAAHHASIFWRAGGVAAQVPADVYHLVDGSHGYVAARLPRAKTIITAHDIIPELQARGHFAIPRPTRLSRWVIQAALRGLERAALVMADSQCTADDLVRLGIVPSGRISVVPLGLPPRFVPQSDDLIEDWESRRSAKDSFLLHIGNNGFYKNRLGAVRTFERVRKQAAVRMVLAGPPPDAALKALIRERQLDDVIEFRCDPDDSEIIDLYRQARLLLFPSLYEGFGWPPLEAMAWGCPVVCSRRGSLPEVVGNAALTADDEDELAAHCVRILTDRKVADELVAAGRERLADFSLDRFRDRILHVYRSVLGRNELLCYRSR